jgi:serine/threonine protein kinase
VPSTHSGRIDPDSSEDVLDIPVEPTDETPTTISRNPPRPLQTPGHDIRGHRLAHFELLEQIGVGGMAAVLKARDTQLDRAVALKILPPDMAADPENVRRFQKEAQAAAKLDHENIARVFFCGEDQGLHFIAFEFVEGENLRMVLDRKGGRLGVGEALSYMIQVAAGLAHAAERGVVHRDIKPSNIIITPDGRAKLVDLGLARNLERRDEKSLTHSGVTLGTFDYISPEQALEPRDADERSDIYSLGCTLYHMLTGRPPVPEGTPARKLHHHTNVKPIDPRELVPDLPDSVVLILNRMMAKRPEDRYQRTAYLLRDLIAAARQIGIQADTPEGVLPVEPPGPGSGRGLSLIVAGIAVAAVVAIIMSLDTPSPDRRTPSASLPGPKDQGTGVKDSTGPDPVPPTPTPGPTNPPVATVTTATYDSEAVDALALAEWLKTDEVRKAQRLVIKLGRDIDLKTDLVETGLLLRASQEVVVMARNEHGSAAFRRPTIKLHYLATEVGPDPPTWAALTIDSPASRIENVRIIVDSSFSKAEMVGLVLKGSGHHVVRNCDFFQLQPADYEKRRLTSILVDPGTEPSSSPRVDLIECCFLGYREQSTQGTSPDNFTLRGVADDGTTRGGGIDGVVVRGEAVVKAADCFFGPHLACFVMNSQRDRDTETVAADHCTFALGDDSTVFQVGDQSAPRFKLERSLAAHLGSATGRSTLVRQAGVRGTGRLLGMDNRYVGLDSYWRTLDGTDIGLDDFQTQLTDRGRGTDDSSQSLVLNPWYKGETTPWSRIDPLTVGIQTGSAGAPRPQEEKDLFAAFRVDVTAPKLRTAKDSREHVIGAEKRGVLAVGKLPDVEERPATARRERIVDPKQNDPTNGIYPTLDQAIFDAKPGDTITLQFNDSLAVKPQRLDEEGIDLIIKAHRDFKPVLTLAETTDTDQYLFRLTDGNLRFENVEIRLQPRKPYASQAVVALFGRGKCVFKDCIVTLDPTLQENTHLSLAALPSMEGVMRMDSRPVVGLPTPHLVLQDSLVRGVGEVVRARVCRPVEVEMLNSLAVLYGSLVAIEGKDGVGTVANPPPISLSLTRTTTCTTAHFLHLKAAKGFKLPLPIRINAAECLFLPAGTSTAFIRLDGTEIEKEKLADRLRWEATRSNAFGSYANMLQQPDFADFEPLTQDAWKTFSGEVMAKYFIRLERTAPSDAAAILKVTPSQFKPMDLNGVGADVSALQGSLPAGE